MPAPGTAEVGSAATVVAAVLENAGYVIQSQILQDFGEFFAHAGALFYIIAAIGGILSITIFGSYRMAQYLLVGPALFWWLVGTTSVTEPVVWKLGGGTPRDVTEVYVDGIETYKPTGEIRVSTFFLWYTRIINDIVNGISDSILKHEDDKDLLFLAETQMYNLIINMRPQREELFSILKEAVFGPQTCQPMLETIMALADYQFTPEYRAVLQYQVAQGSGEAQERLTFLDTRRGELEQQLNTLRTAKPTGPGRAIRKYIIDETREAQRTGGSGGKDYSQLLSRLQAGSADEFIAAIDGGAPLLCGEIWTIAQDRILKETEWALDKGFDGNIRGMLASDPVKGRRMLCEAIGMKLHRDYSLGAPEGGDPAVRDCDLVEVAALWMLRRAVSDYSLQSQAVQSAKNRMALMGGFKARVWTDVPGSPDLHTDLAEREIEILPGKKIKYRVYQTEHQKVPKLEAFDEKTQRWRPFDYLEAPGELGVGVVEQQRYWSRGLMQGIFTYALSIPYWQGTILYFLALAYPFVALLVVVPGRAQAFLYMPLFWLWVKSWDIGFAIVMVLDKVLWNLLPQTDLDYRPLSVNPDQQELPGLLQKVLAIDPTFNIHAHYNFISMALYAVPAITGYAILKGKSGALAAFSNAPRAAADDTSLLGSQAIGLPLANRRLRDMYATGGVAMQSVGMRGEGMMDNGRANWPAALAAFQTGANLFSSHMINRRNYGAQDQILAQNGRGNPAALRREQDRLGRERAGAFAGSIISNAAAGAETFVNLLTTEVGVAAQEKFAFDSLLGRFGRIQRMQEGSASAVDGFGGFEINNSDVAKDVIDLRKGLWWQRVEVASGGGQALLSVVGDLVGAHAPQVANASTALSGGAGMWLVYQNHNVGVNDLQDNPQENPMVYYYQNDPYGLFLNSESAHGRTKLQYQGGGPSSRP